MKLKSKLLSCVVVLSLFGAKPAMALSSWASTILGAVGVIHGLSMTFLNGGNTVWMNGMGITVNTDPAQLIAEAGVLYTMKHITDKWQPEPADTYYKAAANNGAYEQMEFVPENGLENPMNFQLAALQNVGIEALGIGSDLASIMGARSSILGGLEFFQLKPSTAANSATADAGVCTAPYSICKKSLTTAQREAVSTAQEKNKQRYGTAGIAHAELGLKSVQQAIVDDKGALTKEDTAYNHNGAITAFGMTQGKSVTVQDLSSLIGAGKNTYNAMKIVAIMNLELAQRLNEGNMLQGSTLTIEAARAFPKTREILN